MTWIEMVVMVAWCDGDDNDNDENYMDDNGVTIEFWRRRTKEYND